MKEQNKSLLALVGIWIMFGITVVMFWTFVLAYSVPDKAIKIYINTVGEANIEMFILMPIALILGAFAVVYTFRRFNNGR